MPLGLWKSKWEIHREDMARHREDIERHREECERRSEECERRSAEHDEKMERLAKISERRSTEHREEMERHRKEAEQRDAKHHERMERFSEEMRAERAAAEIRWLQLGDETSELRKKYDRELAETRRFNRKMLTQLDKTYTGLTTALGLLGDEMIAMRGDINELKGSVDAQTEAIMKLVDRFEDLGGRPPV